MTPKLSSFLRSGFIALGVIAGLATPSLAGPVGIAPATGTDRLPVQNAIADASTPLSAIEVGRWERRGDYRHRRHARRGWRNDDRWRHGRHWRRHWNDDRWRHRRHRYGSGIYLNFNVPSYNYVEPRYYAPRRIYRGGGLSRTHVEWCYDRYRSYRASDNSFQPYHGWRKQCWSPYS